MTEKLMAMNLQKAYPSSSINGQKHAWEHFPLNIILRSPSICIKLTINVIVTEPPNNHKNNMNFGRDFLLV